MAVIDVLMPTMSGIECARPLQKRYPARVILLNTLAGRPARALAAYDGR